MMAYMCFVPRSTNFFLFPLSFACQPSKALPQTLKEAREKSLASHESANDIALDALL